MRVRQIPVFAQFDIAFVCGFIQRTSKEVGMKRHGNAVRRPSPSHFVDRTLRQDEGSARIRVKLERPAACHYLVFDRPAQYRVDEVFDVGMLWDDARGDGVVLDHEPRPAHLSTR